MRAVLGVLLAALAVLAIAPGGDAAVRKILVASGFRSPVQVDAPPGMRALFVVEQEGRVIRYRSGRKRVFLDIRDRVSCCGERGLLSIAFSPRFRANGLFFVYYTNNNGHSVVARYRANSTRTRAREGTRKRLLFVRQPFANHNGGTLRFGPDNRLYLGLGDGGGVCDPHENAQNRKVLLGKLLKRVATGWRIVGYGLRNPWRMSFDRATGDLLIGDVGQSKREEIDFLRRAQLRRPAENYEWDRFEGTLNNTCENEGLKGSGPRVAPIHEYGRTQGFTVIGGFVYRGSDMPSQRGRYFYGDLSGAVRSFVVSGGSATSHRTERFTIDQLVSFGENRRCELFAVSLGGSLYKLVDR